MGHEMPNEDVPPVLHVGDVEKCFMWKSIGEGLGADLHTGKGLYKDCIKVFKTNIEKPIKYYLSPPEGHLRCLES